MEINKIRDSIQLKDHAFLLILDYDSNPNEVIKVIFNKIITLKANELKLNLDNIINLLEKKQYDDLIWVDCKKQTLKKENILEIKEKFSYSSNNVVDMKFYVIENIENSSNASLNSLLKFVEEPTPNTYAIFTTSNKTAVLNTIISRCKSILLDSDKEGLNKIFSKLNLNSKQIQIYKNIFYDICELEDFLINDSFEIINDIIFSLIEYNSNLVMYKNWEKFKKLEYYQIKIIIKAIFNQTINVSKKAKLIELLKKSELNLNKNLIYYKLIEIIKDGEEKDGI